MRFRHALVLTVVVLIAQGCATPPPLPATYQASPAEIEAVREVFVQSEKAFNAKDLNGIVSVYADDAKIESLAAGGTVGKAAYRDAMAKVFSGPSAPTVRFGTPSIGFIDATRATAQSNLTVGGRSYRVQYQLEKRDGRWLIADQKYF
jgi:uncharacterized protein (TIGR02246 family)